MAKRKPKPTPREAAIRHHESEIAKIDKWIVGARDFAKARIAMMAGWVQDEQKRLDQIRSSETYPPQTTARAGGSGVDGERTGVVQPGRPITG